jgi:hypothetical protein
VHTTTFREGTTTTKVNAFFALELFALKDVVFVCGKCGEGMARDKTLPPVLTPEQAARPVLD